MQPQRWSQTHGGELTWRISKKLKLSEYTIELSTTTMRVVI